MRKVRKVSRKGFEAEEKGSRGMLGRDDARRGQDGEKSVRVDDIAEQMSDRQRSFEGWIQTCRE